MTNPSIELANTLAKRIYAFHALAQSLYWHAVVMRSEDEIESVFAIAFENVERLDSERLLAANVSARLRVPEWGSLLTRIRDGVRAGNWGEVQADARRLMEFLRTEGAVLGADTRLTELFPEAESSGRRPRSLRPRGEEEGAEQAIGRDAFLAGPIDIQAAAMWLTPPLVGLLALTLTANLLNLDFAPPGRVRVAARARRCRRDGAEQRARSPSTFGHTSPFPPIGVNRRVGPVLGDGRQVGHGRQGDCIRRLADPGA